jgi:hypothetical protein
MEKSSIGKNYNILLLPRYWNGVHKELNEKLKKVKESIDHPTTGVTAEKYLCDLIRDYLPRRYIVESGFAVDSSGNRSPKIDILIADTLNIPPLCCEPNYKVFAIEAVTAAIEITTGPKNKVNHKGKKVSKFESDIDKLATVRTMGRVRTYDEMVPTFAKDKMSFKRLAFSLELCPRAFIITSGDEWQKSDTYKNNLIHSLKCVRQNNINAFLNAAFSFKHGMLHFLPHENFETRWYRNNSLLEFLLFINNAISTFDTFKIDIRKYRNTIPEIEL